MDTKALRQKILDLAIRGKLVPQDPNDEPASVLLERIREQKEQMVKEGKLKPKDIKNDSIIFVGEDNLHYEKFQDGTVKCIEDEIPFKLPEGWAWCKINTIAFVTKLAGFEYTKNIAPSLCEDGIPLFKGKNVQNSSIIYEFESFIPEAVSDELQRSQITKKCILTPYVGTIGNIGIHNRPGKYHLGSNVGKIEIYNDDVVLLEEYVVSYLQSGYGYQQLTKHMKATAQASISIEAIRDVYLPVPPASEQIRMWEALSKALTLIECIENTKLDIADLIKSAKSKILDLAIRGQLVPQNPDDEPVPVLLERIRAEKEELIKQGKIKRDKKESIIFKGEDNSYYETINSQTESIDDDIPFELPDNWSWARLSHIVQILNGDRGQNYPAKNKLQKNGIPFVSASNIDSGIVSSNDLLCMTDEQYDALGAGKLISGDIVYCIRGSLGKCGIFTMEKGAIASSLVIARPFIADSITTQYIFNYLNSNLAKIEITKYDNGSAQPNLAAKDFMRFLVPIPPKNEQCEINNLLHKMYSYINYIESALL